MTGFKWSPRAFTLAQDRFEKLADDSDGYLYDMLRKPVFESGKAGLLNLLLIHHDKLIKEVAVSAGCTPAMLRKINSNLAEVGTLYANSNDRSRERIEKVWDDLGFDLPTSGDANLEQYDQGAYNFGSDYPPHGYPGKGDFSIQDTVNFILGLPKSAVLPQGGLKNPALQAIWDMTCGLWEELCTLIASLLSGDWDTIYTAGDAMTNASDYWINLGAITRRAAGTLFSTWDGNASEHAEHFVAKICDLYDEAARDISECGESYKLHAHGCYVVFNEVKGVIPGIPDSMKMLFQFLDKADKNASPIGIPLPDLSAINDLIKMINKSIAEVTSTLLKVIQVIKAIVGVALAAQGLFADYNNEMKGALG
ncbi:hypothetical protein BLA60_28020 [Actinophytocola xinjiangensis]|uniref:Uncharacterized protein n=1 Tax=Actinophytocola xinjiangensis TaxID=485602 RepID=A0A7Z0WHK4_9PSEU|nr:hypothetical protein [Actinophytocola xinjiangensis]OLF07409.1 hypothetical protein BLA60_28020 [Actinophytocola xinjiangensis]